MIQGFKNVRRGSRCINWLTPFALGGVVSSSMATFYWLHGQSSSTTTAEYINKRKKKHSNGLSPVNNWSAFLFHSFRKAVSDLQVECSREVLSWIWFSSLNTKSWVNATLRESVLFTCYRKQHVDGCTSKNSGGDERAFRCQIKRLSNRLYWLMQTMSDSHKTMSVFVYFKWNNIFGIEWGNNMPTLNVEELFV